jgi:hypothetical protein
MDGIHWYMPVDWQAEEFLLSIGARRLICPSSNNGDQVRLATNLLSAASVNKNSMIGNV